MPRPVGTRKPGDRNYTFHLDQWTNGAFIDLNDTINDPSWLLTTATAINDRGQIAATASHNGGAFQAVLLTPR